MARSETRPRSVAPDPITTAEYYAQRLEGLDDLEMATIPSFRVEGFDAHQMVLFVREDAPDERIWLVQSPDRVPSEDPNAALEGWLASGGDPCTTRSSTVS